MRSYLPVNSQDDFVVVKPSVAKKMCAQLAANGTRYLVADVPLDASALSMIDACGYTPTDAFGTAPPNTTVLARR